MDFDPIEDETVTLSDLRERFAGLLSTEVRAKALSVTCRCYKVDAAVQYLGGFGYRGDPLPQGR